MSRVRLSHVVATVAMLAGVSPAARADLIDFTMDGATFSYDSGTDTLSGGFVWDTSTDQPISSTLTISGDSASEINGTYSVVISPLGPYSLYLTQPWVNVDLDLNFSTSLSTLSPGESSAFAGGYFRDLAGGCGYCTFGSPTGTADAIPEPASLALFSLGGAALWSVRRRRGV